MSFTRRGPSGRDALPIRGLAARGRSECAGKAGTGSEIPRRNGLYFQGITSAEFRSQSPFFRLDEFCHGLLGFAHGCSSMSAPSAVATRSMPTSIAWSLNHYKSTPAKNLGRKRTWQYSTTDGGEGADKTYWRSKDYRLRTFRHRRKCDSIRKIVLLGLKLQIFC